MDNRKITLVISTYRQFEDLLKSFGKVINDERINEILIVDDNSENNYYWNIEEWLQFDAPEKVRLAQNTAHIGEYLNRRMGILLADGEWILTTNSNNIIEPEQIDKLFNQTWNEKTMIEIGSDTIFVNRAEYLRLFDVEDEVFWVKAGNKIKLLK